MNFDTNFFSWIITPNIVNAYYDPSKNAICKFTQIYVIKIIIHQFDWSLQI